MSEKTTEMATLEGAPIFPLLVKYSLPAIAGMVAFSLYNVVDSIFIGQWIGADALAAIAIAFPVMNLTFALGTLVGIGGAAVTSIRLGEKKLDAALAVLGNVLLMSLALGVGFGWGTNAFLAPILRAFGAGENTLEPAYDFMRVILFGLPATFLFFNLNHVMRASGYPRKAMLSTIITVLVNVALAPLFIRVFGWGMRGAGAATVIAQLFGLVWILAHFLNPKSVLAFSRGIFRPSFEAMRSIVAIGLSPCLMNVCACVVVVVINRALLEHGGDVGVAAYGILSRVQIVIGMIVIGITQGMQPIVGYNHGAGATGRVRETLRYGVIAGTAVTALGGLACVLLPHLISVQFTDDAALLAVSDEALRLSCLAFPLVGMQIVIGNFYQAIGHAKLAIFLSMTRQMLFLIPLLIAFPHFWGTRGVWLSFPVADFLAWALNVVLILVFLKSYSAVPADVAGTLARREKA